MYTLSVDHLVGQQTGRYHIERLLGRGQLTAVYLAQDAARNRPVALTAFLIPEQFSFQARTRFIQRFQQEAATLLTLQHEHILSVYDYGEHVGFPYLVTPSTMHGSLAGILKQQKRCTQKDALKILEQVVAGVAYAHSQGTVHGALQPSNMLVSGKQTMLVSGFGLMKMLQLRGVASNDQPYAHLLSVAGTFLFPPGYLAPEVVGGQLADPRSDIYVLGIILFELLSGHPPFTGTNAFDVARQHMQLPIPSLRTRCPELPAALVSVVNQALARDPARRFQHAHEFVEAFAEVAHSGTHSSGWEHVGDERHQETKAEGEAPARWQITPPIITGKMAAIQPSAQERTPTTSLSPHTGALGIRQFVSPHATGERTAVQPATFKEKEADLLHAPQPVRWMPEPDRLPPSSVTPAHPPLKRSRRLKRRQVVALFALGGVGAAGALVAIGANLASRSVLQPSPLAKSPSSTMTGMQMQGTRNGNAGSTTGTKQQSAVDHTGMVIGSLNMAFNASADFVNPADHQKSVLIHLPSGEFVAYEKACSLQGDQVSYNSETHTLVCPTTGSIFDPANDGAVLQGPAASPLKQVMVRVNRDGTITTG